MEEATEMRPMEVGERKLEQRKEQELEYDVASSKCSSLESSRQVANKLTAIVRR